MRSDLHPSAGTKLRDVETASAMMRRYYKMLRETMRAMAGYLPAARSWPAKKMLARHIWLDAMHADLLRARTLDLRYPRVDVDGRSDAHLTAALRLLPNAGSDAVFLERVYGTVKPALREAFARYVQESDPLDDAPSHVYLKRILHEFDEELKEYAEIAGQLAVPRNEAEAERTLMADLLRSCGGTDGPDRPADASLAARFGSGEYHVPLEAGRDPAWDPAVMQVPPRPPAHMMEHRVWVAIDHANEVWAAETAASLIWEYDHMPWQLHLQAARWTYDEMRHAMMGEQRLASWGFRIGVDYPMVPDHWRAFRGEGIGSLLLLLHGLEQKGPLHKARLKKELSAASDFDSAQDCDYDWADESGHISFGLAWIKAVFPDWTKERIMRETERLIAEWRAWIERKHRDGTHGYERFMPRIEAITDRYKDEGPEPGQRLAPVHFIK